MVVGIIVVNHRADLAVRHACRREVHRIVETILAKRAKLAQLVEVFQCTVRVILAGEDRGVRRDHRILAEAALEAKRRYAEVGVLVVHVVIAGVECRFGNAPRRAETAAVVHLFLDDQIVGLIEDAALTLLHDQRRHQIFEHRARPGDQGTLRTDRHDLAAETVPVLGR